MGRYSYPMNDDREMWFDRLRVLFDEHKDPGADEIPKSVLLDICIQTTLEFHENLHEHGDDLPPNLVRKLSTEYVGVHYRTNTYPSMPETW